MRLVRAPDRFLNLSNAAGLQSITKGVCAMDANDLKQMIEYTKNWRAWLENVKMSDKDEVGKQKLIDQMNEAIKKWEKELR